MAVIITTHDSSGAAVFSKRGLEDAPRLPIPPGYIQMISATNSFPVNLSMEEDIDDYTESRNSPFYPGTRRICPDNGTATCIITMKPGAGGPMHRTMTLDTVVILEGEIEIELDSGEKKLLKTGDAVVQRATIHRWTNVTPDNGCAKWIVFIQAAAEPLRIGDIELKAEWDH